MERVKAWFCILKSFSRNVRVGNVAMTSRSSSDDVPPHAKARAEDQSHAKTSSLCIDPATSNGVMNGKHGPSQFPLASSKHTDKKPSVSTKSHAKEQAARSSPLDTDHKKRGSTDSRDDVVSIMCSLDGFTGAAAMRHTQETPIANNKAKGQHAMVPTTDNTEKEQHVVPTTDKTEKRHKNRKRKRSLDETTLSTIRDHLQQQRCNEVLDVDAVEKELIETNLIIQQQRKNNQAASSDPCADSEEEEQQNQLHQKQEAYYVMAERFFQQTIGKAAAAITKRNNRASSGSVPHQPSSRSKERQQHSWDEKTLKWLRRAMGIFREKKPVWDGVEISQDTKAQHHEPNKKVTRSRARSERVKKRQERVARENQGIDALVGAVQELEAKLPLSKKRRKKAPEKKAKETNSSKRQDTSGVQEGTKKRKRNPATNLVTANGARVIVKVGGQVMNELGQVVVKPTIKAQRQNGVNRKPAVPSSRKRQKRRSVPLTDRHFELWFQYMESVENKK